MWHDLLSVALVRHAASLTEIVNPAGGTIGLFVHHVARVTWACCADSHTRSVCDYTASPEY